MGDRGLSCAKQGQKCWPRVERTVDGQNQARHQVSVGMDETLCGETVPEQLKAVCGLLAGRDLVGVSCGILMSLKGLEGFTIVGSFMVKPITRDRIQQLIITIRHRDGNS